MDTVEQLKAALSKGCRFVNFTYQNKDGEIAKHTLLLGVSYANALKKDLANLEKQNMDGVKEVARQELLASFRNSLYCAENEIKNLDYTCKDVYDNLGKGIKRHKQDGSLHVHGWAVNKQIIKAGVYKIVKSNEKTLAKNEIKKTLKSGKLRQFKLDNIQSIRMNGKVIELT